MEWPPESAVSSRTLRPLEEKEETRLEKLNVGAGIWLFAALWLAVLASLRPSCTVHVGPPSCNIITIQKVEAKMTLRKKKEAYF